MHLDPDPDAKSSCYYDYPTTGVRAVPNHGSWRVEWTNRQPTLRKTIRKNLISVEKNPKYGK
jgi:hypothetical protein